MAAVNQVPRCCGQSAGRIDERMVPVFHKFELSRYYALPITNAYWQVRRRNLPSVEFVGLSSVYLGMTPATSVFTISLDASTLPVLRHRQRVGQRKIEQAGR